MDESPGMVPDRISDETEKIDWKRYGSTDTNEFELNDHKTVTHH